MPTLTERLSDLQITGTGLSRITVETASGEVSALRGRGRRAEAPPVVLLHGMGSCASDLAGLLRRLRRHASLRLAPDLPGHGHSPVPAPGLEPDRMADQLGDALARLLDRPAVVFGSSLGGLAAVRFAQRHPDRVRSLVLASPAGAPMPDADLKAFFEALRIDDASAARRFIDQTITRTAVPRALLAWGLRDRFDQPHIAGLLGQVQPRHMLRSDELRALDMPVHLLWGDGDRLLPEGHFEWFARHLPAGSTATRVPGAGHAPYLERPGPVAAVIQAALGGQRAAAA
jgi:pimeloyl-ACP methyl ester carboxylesterase